MGIIKVPNISGSCGDENELKYVKVLEYTFSISSKHCVNMIILFTLFEEVKNHQGHL